MGERHYALVVLRDLEPGSSTEYEVHLDGTRRWPERDSPFPASRIQTLPGTGTVRIVWGSCRVSRPHTGSCILDVDEHPEGVGVDALHALVLRMRDQPPEQWPGSAAVGDQVYADEVSPETWRDSARGVTRVAIPARRCSTPTSTRCSTRSPGAIRRSAG